MKLKLLIVLFLFNLIAFSQSGKITVRKTENNLLGKKLQLNDLRGAKAGTISFKSKTKAAVVLEIDIKNPLIQLNFGNEIPKRETLNCSYSIINDTLLLLKHNNYQDTCFYNYISDSINIVQLKHTLHGMIDNYFAVFYHFDSILLSSSINKFQSDSLFSQNIEIDSVYKNVQDKKLKKELEKSLKEELIKYNQNLSYTYFKGQYLITIQDIKLLSNQIEFAEISLKYDTINGYYVSPKYIIDGKTPILSEYGYKRRSNYIYLKYDSAFLTYNLPHLDQDIPLNIKTFNVKHYNNDSAMLYSQKDTIVYYKQNGASIKGTIGGNFNTYIKSLNDKKYNFKNLYFTYRGIYELDNNNIPIDNIIDWHYKLTDSALYIYNSKDTLVDELSIFFNRISFTYKNNEPIIFGTYHYKTNEGKHNFLILFDNKTGIKFTSNTFDYKEAREILKNKLNIKHNSLKFSEFTYSNSKDFLWLNFDDGKYQKLSFFNYNKAIKEETKEQTNNYYLIE